MKSCHLTIWMDLEGTYHAKSEKVKLGEIENRMLVVRG